MFVFPFIEVRFVLETILLATRKNLTIERSNCPLFVIFQVWMGP